MRRQDREVTDGQRIDSIIGRCHCCRLGFQDGGQVYLVPLSFGYVREGEQRLFYFHSAREGRKIQLIRDNPRVGFELDTNYLLHEADVPCGFSARFQSVTGTGTVSFVEEEAERLAGLRAILRHYAGEKPWDFSPQILEAVCVFKLTVESLSCKEHP